MSQKKDGQVAEYSKRALNHSIEQLTPETRQALYAAREHALQRRSRTRLVPLLASAFTIALVGLLWLNLAHENGTSPTELALQNDSDVIDTFTYLTVLDETDQEIVEDLDFAIWLSQQLEAEHGDVLSERT